MTIPPHESVRLSLIKLAKSHKTSIRKCSRLLNYRSTCKKELVDRRYYFIVGVSSELQKVYASANDVRLQLRVSNWRDDTLAMVAEDSVRPQLGKGVPI